MGLSQLWDLQEMHLRRQELQRQLQTSALARELKKEKERLEALRESVRTRMQEREELLQEIAVREKVCHDLQTKRKHLEMKLYSGTTNNPKELSNLQQQMATIVTDLQAEEEKTLEITSRREELDNWLATSTATLQAGRQAYREKLAGYRTWLAGLQQEIDVLAVNAAQLEAEIEPHLLDLYCQLRRRLGVRALARVVKGSCSGCNLIIPSFLLREIRSGKTVYCESCGRLLLP